jgi:hypothetical protein
VASVFDHQQPIVFVACLPKSLLLRMEAAETLGQASLAEAYRQRLISLGRSDLLVIAQ